MRWERVCVVVDVFSYLSLPLLSDRRPEVCTRHTDDSLADNLVGLKLEKLLLRLRILIFDLLLVRVGTDRRLEIVELVRRISIQRVKEPSWLVLGVVALRTVKQVQHRALFHRPAYQYQ